MIFSTFRKSLRRASKTTAQPRELARPELSRRMVSRAVSTAIENLEDRTHLSFSAPVSYPAGTAPVAMISGDFNNDGRLDTLTTNSAPASVTVLLGNGDGTFAAPLNTSLGLNIPGSRYTGSQAGTVAVGDFNADGRLDVSVISANNAVTLLGNGDGTFAAPLSTYIGSSPSRLSTGDVNGDGKADLLVANTAGTVSVSLSNGDGTFAAEVDYAAGPAAQDVKAADLNHDGKLDLTVANAVSAGSISTLMGNGDGTFQPYKSYSAFSAPYRMNVADYNGDGNMDVGVANSYTSSCVTILLGNPDGTFQPYHSYDTGSQPWELESKDVDGDGKPDLIDSNGFSYQVELNNGDGTFTAQPSIAGAGWVFAAGDFNGDGTADIAGASGSNIGVLINTSSAITHISTAVGFQVSAPSATTAGAALPLTLSAVDANGNVVSDFTGNVHLTTTDPRMSGLTFTFTAADAGTHTFASGVSLYTAGSQTISIAGPAALAGSASINVNSAAASRFVITADATAVAGSPASFTITAQDAYGNLAADYTGTIHFTSNDPQASLPADYTFSAADAGIATFSTTLKTAGNRTITAIDTTNGMTRGVSSAINVTPSAATTLGLVGGGGHIGSPHIVTITAFDIYGNIATGYNGLVHLTGSDSLIQLPADGAMINGIGSFIVTPMTLGAQTLTASSAAMTGTETITGTPGDASRFVVSTVSGGVAGSTRTVTITAYDSFGNVAVDYAGTVYFSSSDLQASLPYYTFTAADIGTHTFSLILRTAGSQSITVCDLYNPAITTTQTGILVTAASATTMTVTALHGTVAGVSQNVTVTARDAFGNIATDYRGTIAMASSDLLANIPATYTFTAADAGTHVFAIALKSAGGQTFTAQDTTTALMNYSQRDIQVSAAAMAGFALRAPSNATAGVAFSFTVSAVDAFGNVVSGYTGKIHFSGPSGIPADYTFTAADSGVHTFLLTISATGTQTIGVQDTVTGSWKAQISVAIKTGSTSTGGGGGTATGGGGTGGGKKVP